MSNPEPVSVVILTRDEGANIRECIDEVLQQMRDRDEIVVVDSASCDDTVAICERYAFERPGKLRMHAYPANVGSAEARATAIEMAKHDVLVFVSAAAVPEPGWLDALRGAVANADVVYGRQRHAAPRAGAATVSRGLRYHRYEKDVEALPETFASRANAAYRRFAFETLASHDALAGHDDAALAREARLAGLRLAYARDALVSHKDVASWSAEWRRRLLEGAARATRRDLLGTPRGALLWALAVGATGIAAVALASAWLLALCVMLFFAPTIRRVASPVVRRYKAPHLVGGVAASPFFDLAFVGGYLARRVRRTRG
ncbi:MAG TPA: glycosyltransferase family 2 protein [Candidatus Thermoplasmatota archaeon]|nr:glycosyltransferase family 2 protein [Candidatus Thermoplasmatota archaeon]